MKGPWTHALVKRLPRRGSTAMGVATAFWVVAQGLTLSLPANAQTARDPLSYSALLTEIDAGKVNRIEIDPTQRVARVTLEGQKKGDPPREVALFDNYGEITKKALANKVDITVQPTQDNSAMMGILANLLLFFLLIGGLLMILRRSSNAPGGPGQAMSFGKSRARFQMEAKTGVMFDDVAGIEEAKEELQEV
ncbi:MAG: cell division protein FtsH, partial [Stenomitos rutilans HA7619-LM2]|nr:cell division protein FtsH [Stenomitos rutilans HA7619-LM2]